MIHLYSCIVIAIFIAMISLYMIYDIKYNCVFNFLNPHSKQHYKYLVYQYGTPEVIYNKVGGFVIWYPKHADPKSPFSSIVLRDESISHLGHKDFLYATVIVNLSDTQINQIENLSSFTYDKEKNELTVRCSSLDNIRAIFYLLFYKLNTTNTTNTTNTIELTEDSVIKSMKNGKLRSLDEYILKQSDNVNKEKLQYVGGEKFQIPIQGSKRKIVERP